MAKYDDYLESEISEASENQQARDDKGRFIPQRFQNKDITDVIKSYEELEKLNSRQAQDLGTMRQQVDQMLEAQQMASSPTPEPSKPVSVDDLYADADGNIRRVVREEALGEITELKKELNDMRLQNRLGQISSKYPEWQTKVSEPDFKTWVQDSPYRVRMVQEADAGDLDAAEEVLGMYYDSIQESEGIQEQARTQNKARLNDAMLESSSPPQAEMVDTYSRSELMERRLAAKKGDLSAERWLTAHGPAISLAYEEGRIVD